MLWTIHVPIPDEITLLLFPKGGHNNNDKRICSCLLALGYEYNEHECGGFHLLIAITYLGSNTSDSGHATCMNSRPIIQAHGENWERATSL